MQDLQMPLQANNDQEGKECLEVIIDIYFQTSPQ
jgi:hypothetical protein